MSFITDNMGDVALAVIILAGVMFVLLTIAMTVEGSGGCQSLGLKQLIGAQQELGGNPGVPCT